MATTALIQEKIWLDKSSYDRAERLHFERLAKVLPVKITDENSIIYNSSASNDFPIVTDTTTIQKSKSKKVTFSKLVPQDINVIESTKNLKNSKKGKKKGDVCKSQSIKINAYVIQKNEDNDLTNTSVAIKKSKAKEVKEKKNKADKKQRIVEEDKMSSQESKDQLLIHQGQPSICSISPAGGSLANEVAKARQHIKQSLQCMDGIAALAGVSDSDLVSRVVFLEKENQDLRNIVQELRSLVTKTDSRMKELEGRVQSLEELPLSVPALQICPQKPTTKDDDDDEDVDLFLSDSDADDAEATKIREERLAAYAEKKTKKPALIAKSNIILDVKPWDDETDMKAMEAEVRKIQADGLLWGAAKLVPVAFKIQKLQISCVVEDDKVSVDWLTETIEEIEDYVQSVDIAAFNKV